MNKIVAGLCVFVALAVIADAESEPMKIINVELGGHCALGAAPVNGVWQVVEKNVKKICPPGSSCRRGACNCDDLEDGTVMSLANDDQGNRVCRRVAGQKCTADNQCFKDVSCTKNVCTCAPGKDCEDKKNDVTILA